MNKTFSLKQISRTGNLDAILIPPQHQLVLMARYKEIESVKPKMRQKEIAKELG